MCTHAVLIHPASVLVNTLDGYSSNFLTLYKALSNLGMQPTEAIATDHTAIINDHNHKASSIVITALLPYM